MSAPKTPESAKKPPRGVYLPALPDGASYHVQILSDHGDVTITSGSSTDPNSRQVIFKVEGTTRVLDAPDMNSACKAAVKGLRALDAVRREEKALAEARDAALAGLGQITNPTSTTGQ